MPKKAEVTLDKKQVEALLEELKSLRVKVDKLEQEKQLIPRESKSKPLLHSLSRAKEDSIERQYRREREAVKSPEVQRAIDLLIAYYFTNPPPHRRPEVEEILSQKTIAELIRESKKSY